jgi:ribokinase
MDTKKKIVVIGSSNTDMVIKSDRLPKPGETILGGNFLMNHGGKGANQAVAAARLGGDVTFICKIGNDIFGNETLEMFHKEGIDTTYVGITAGTIRSSSYQCRQKRGKLHCCCFRSQRDFIG